MLPASVDVAVIGAGPAGSTLATLLRKYRPETSVLVLEKARFPRHQIGESLLVDVNRVLDAMGCLDDVEAAGFSRKYGATFVWGRERTVFSFLWKEGVRSVVNPPSGYHLDYTWHVDRPRYDAILVSAARRAGAIVEEGWTALAPFGDGERVRGIRARSERGDEREVSARFVIDCANDRGPLHRQLAEKKLDETLRNVAVFGYLRGVAFDRELNGADDERRTAILTHPRGWCWVIPLSGGVTSVGFVTAVASYEKEPGASQRAYFEAALRELPEFERLFAHAELVDYRGDGRLAHSVQEWSYECARIWGPGWATCGNAAGFVDAILSIGCFVAQNHAQFLACTLASVLDGDAAEGGALDCYATTVEENLAAFRSVAAMFYAFNTSMSDWWRECSAQLRKSTLVPGSGDRSAFLAFFTGFSARTAIYDQAVNALGGSFLRDVGEQLFGDEAVFQGDALGAEASRARALIERDPVLRLAEGAALRPFLLPHLGTGRLVEVARLDLPPAQRLYLPAALARAVEAIDGRRSISGVCDAIGGEGDRGVLRREVSKLAYRLACMGAVTAV
jgi:flavin-dependent dehydrogenase